MKLGCAKIRYADRAAAEQALRRAGHAEKRNKGRSRGVRSYYRCPACGYWHLSSQTPRERQGPMQPKAGR